MGFFDRLKFYKQLPEKRLQILVGGDFEKVGNEFLPYFITLGELKSNETILDVGCGCGRIALPLTTFLCDKGQYFGFDIEKESIIWCEENISKKFPNFQFYHSDIYNQFYNAKGKISPDKYFFPFANKSFDFIFLTSVFTHMLPDDMEHYLTEISRTLKDNGRCLITFFLLNDDTEKLFKTKKQELKFIYGEGIYRTTDAIIKEVAISYDEAFIKNLFSKYGLTINNPIYYGSWCGREKYLSYQDIIIARKL